MRGSTYGIAAALCAFGAAHCFTPNIPDAAMALTAKGSSRGLSADHAFSVALLPQLPSALP